MLCTVVTSYYCIKSKFSKDKYLEWGRTFLKLDAPIVLFTENEFVDTIKELRGNKPIDIRVIPFEELEMWKLYKDKWKMEYEKDLYRDRYGHSPELYALWAQKCIFVEKAIEKNPFETSYFFWCDFGAFRDPTISPQILSSFPCINYLPKNRIILQSVDPLRDDEKVRGRDNIYGKCLMIHNNQARLVGGLWGGGKNGCLTWKKAYQEMLEKYFQSNRYAGNDQMIMLSTYMNNPKLAIVVRPSIQIKDQWFFLEYLLSSISCPFEVDNSYFL